MKFERVSSGAPWEKKIGYCRAVRAGNQIFVSGTASVADDGSCFAPGDGYKQTHRCIDIIETALKKLGADLTCVVKTRVYVTDFKRWPEYGRAHAERFGANPPASLMVEVRALVDPAMLVEVEADAIVPNGK